MAFSLGEKKSMAGTNDYRPYDLEERTAKFGEEVIDFMNKVPNSPLTKTKE